MKAWTMAAAMAVIYAVPVWGQEAGNCISVDEADRLLKENGETIVGDIPVFGPTGIIGMRFLVERPNGTYKEVVYDLSGGVVCHVQDFIGDPRVPDAGA